MHSARSEKNRFQKFKLKFKFDLFLAESLTSLVSDKSLTVQQKFMLLFNCKLYEFEKKTSAHFLKRLSFLNYKEFNTEVFERKIWESEIWYNISSI